MFLSTKDNGSGRYYGSYEDLKILVINVNLLTFLICKNGSKIINTILNTILYQFYIPV